MQEGSRLFKMCLCIKDRFFLESLYTTVSKNAALVSNVSAVNAIVGCTFACSKPETALEKSLTPRVPKILVMYRKCSN